MRDREGTARATRISRRQGRGPRTHGQGEHVYRPGRCGVAAGAPSLQLASLFSADRVQNTLPQNTAPWHAEGNGRVAGAEWTLTFRFSP